MSKQLVNLILKIKLMDKFKIVEKSEFGENLINKKKDTYYNLYNKLIRKINK